MVSCLDKDEVVCFDEDVVVSLDEGVVAYLDKNSKFFCAYFLLSHPLEYIIEETLDGQCIVHHGSMKKIG